MARVNFFLILFDFVKGILNIFTSKSRQGEGKFFLVLKDVEKIIPRYVKSPRWGIHPPSSSFPCKEQFFLTPFLSTLGRLSL